MDLPRAKRAIFFLLPFLSLSVGLQGQADSTVHDAELRYCTTLLLEGDTVPEIRTKTVVVNGNDQEKSKAYQRKYERLKPKVVKVYPYAEVAGLLLQHYEKKLQGIELEARKKFYMKKVESDLKAEFKDEITELTVSEGRILMKLIDRETGNTSYQIIEELRGNFAALFWQSVARVFGHDLRSRYDPVGSDRVLEAIVLDIKSGELEVPKRSPQSKKVRQLLQEQKDPGRWWKLKS